MKKLLMTLIVAIAFSGSVFAQIDGSDDSKPTNWPEFDYHAYMYNAPFVAGIMIDDVIIDCNNPNWENYEVAPFVGNACRGNRMYLHDDYVLEWGDPFPVIWGKYIYYTDANEVVSFQMYDHANGILYTECVAYQDDAPVDILTGVEHTEGWDEDPSHCIVLHFTSPTTTGYQLTINPHNGEAGHYYLISSPVGSVEVDEVGGMIASVEEEYDLYMFSQTPDDDGYEWYNYKTGAFANLEPGKGYLYASKNGTDLVFNGTAYTATGTFGLDYVDATISEFPGLNLMGNPFGVAATVDKAFYTLVDGSEYAEHVAGATVDAMLGVIVFATEEGQNVTFTPEGGKKSVNAAFSITHNGNFVDRAMMVFDGKELPKVQLNPNHTKIYMPVNGKDYAVASVESFGEMPVNFKAENDGTYTLNFTSEEVSFNYLHLIDNMTGADVDLLVNPAYTFDANRSDYANRFKLVFATSDASNSDFAFVSNGNIIVNGEGLLQVIDMTGRIISSEQISGVSSIKLNAAAGVYVLQLNGNTQKIVVK